MNLLKKVKHLLLGFIAITMIFSCGKENIQNDVLDQNEQITALAKEQLEISKEIWNESFSEKMTLVSYEYKKEIDSEEEKLNIINEITSDVVLIGYGNIQEPESIEVKTLSTAIENEKKTIERMRSFAEEAISIGDQLLEINWTNGNDKYKTICIANKNGIIWDNVLTNVISVDINDNKELISTGNKSGALQKSYYKRLYWIWGAIRGEMGSTITIYHNGSTVYNTDHSNFAWMSVGNAKSESKILNNSGPYGKIRYALGLSTPTINLSFNYANFSVSATGIGSKRVANGTMSISCP